MTNLIRRITKANDGEIRDSDDLHRRAATREALILALRGGVAAAIDAELLWLCLSSSRVGCDLRCGTCCCCCCCCGIGRLRRLRAEPRGYE